MLLRPPRYTLFPYTTLFRSDLLVGERAHFLPVDCDHANRLVVLKHRHGDHCADARDVRPGNGKWEIGRASCRERGEMAGVHGALEKKGVKRHGHTTDGDVLR